MNRSSLMFLVPDAEPIVGALRMAHDPSAFAGIGAHITLLFPFMHPSKIDDAILARLKLELSNWKGPIELRFDRVERFPGLAYLALANPEPVMTLIRALAAAWPEYPLYEGKFTTITPHLTIAHGETGVLDAVDAEVAPKLPIVTTVRDVSLFVEDEQSHWSERARFPL